MGVDVLSRNADTMINQSPNLKAFLHLIRTGEGTLGADGYRTMYGGKLFDSFADHPRIKVKAGKWTSTAAGAYQFLSKTWDGLVAKYPSILIDFSPEYQDEGAVMLIKGRGAFADVLAGRFRAAIMKCNKEWASLPLSPYGQPTLTMEKATQILIDAGGQFEPVAKQEKPVLPIAASILVNAIPSLLNALPEIANIFKGPDVAARNVEVVSKVGAILMQSTGAANEQEAVERVLADPQTADEANTALRGSRADLLDLVERLNTMEQGNIKSAREYNTAEPLMINTRWLKLKFIHLLSFAFMGFAAWFASFYFLNITAELRGAIITLMIIGGWNKVGDYWMGSSSGSDKKTEMMKDRQ